MGNVLRRRLRQARFESAFQEAVFNVLVTSGHLRERIMRVLERNGVTLSQYNALRILRGAQPAGLPRCEIAPRMLERAPDVTRLVDRLVEAGYVERSRSGEDRRQSIARITRKGLALIERVHPEMSAAFRQMSGRITDREAETLSLLCEKLYEEDV